MLYRKPTSNSRERKPKYVTVHAAPDEVCGHCFVLPDDVASLSGDCIDWDDDVYTVTVRLAEPAPPLCVELRGALTAVRP